MTIILYLTMPLCDYEFNLLSRMTELEDNSRPCLYPNEDESTLKQQLSRMGMHMNDTSVDGKVAHVSA